MSVVLVVADDPATAYGFDTLDATERAALYRATLTDQLVAADGSGGDLLVNYPENAETAVREVVDEADVEARFEVQVGSDRAARVGNAVTHLLDTEEANSVIVTDGRAPFIVRSTVDSAAMRLRRHEAVFAPGGRGRVALAGFCDPVDFEGAYESPALRTLAERCADAGLSADFLPTTTLLGREDDLRAVAAHCRARATVGQAVPDHTLARLDEFEFRA